MAFFKLRTVAAAVGMIGCATIVAVYPAKADQYNRRTILTVNEPMQVRDTLLPPGQYVFKLLDSASSRNIVQIYNRDETHLIDTILAIPNYRVRQTGSSRFTFWETPPGSAKALRAWFYPGDNWGQEFTYPKHIVMLASLSTAQEAAAVTAPPAAAIAPEPAAAIEPQAQAEVQQPAPENQPVEIAQNTPPPPPPAPETPAPATLPKTGSNYPLFGLAGFLSLGLFGLLRLKRTA